MKELLHKNDTTEMSRREFLAKLVKLSLVLGATPLVSELLIEEAFARKSRRLLKPDKKSSAISSSLNRIEVWHYKKLPNSLIQCFICPLNCVLEDGETCFCRTRTNYGGTLYNEAYQNPCILQVDPIEKGPFYHYRPATKTLSLGTAGCNLRCIFCQNWQISQKKPCETKNYSVPVQTAPSLASTQECGSITFTYTEPVVFSEYVYKVAEAARSVNIPCQVATSGFINERPLREWCKVINAFVVSIKACNDSAYKRICGQPMGPVLDTLKVIRSENKWLELVYVVIPTINDNIKEIGGLAKWISKELGSEVPLHLARFFPAYKLQNLPRTPVKQLEDARKSALDAGLKFVYLDNVPGHPDGNTYCPSCREMLVERVGFKTLQLKVDASGRCPKCKTQIPGIWA